MKQPGGKVVQGLAIIGLVLAVVLIGISLSSIFKKDDADVVEKKIELKPMAPIQISESQEAINARVKLSAELASAISRIEELERSRDVAMDDLSRVKDELTTIGTRVSYQSGGIDQIKASLRSLADKPEPVIPKTFRLNVVNYDGEKLHRAKVLKKELATKAKQN